MKLKAEEEEDISLEYSTAKQIQKTKMMIRKKQQTTININFKKR